jgi:NADPH:quinone reductase-like Zn-dependent oxidoreductase
MQRFSAFRIHLGEDGSTRAGIEPMALDELSAGDVLIRVVYSAVNYNDALAGTGRVMMRV